MYRFFKSIIIIFKILHKNKHNENISQLIAFNNVQLYYILGTFSKVLLNNYSS
jgi:hypothetical protein